MTTLLTEPTANVICDALTALVDNGPSAPRVQYTTTSLVYDATTILVTIPLATPQAYRPASNGIASLVSQPREAVATLSGTAVEFRVLNGNGVPVWGGTMGPNADDGIVISEDIEVGNTVVLESLDVECPHTSATRIEGGGWGTIRMGSVGTAANVSPVPTTGWTDLTPGPSTIVYYVSTSGDDANDGLTEATPVRNPQTAINRLPTGAIDAQVLLRRGDLFTSGFQPSNGTRWGISPTQRYVISAYGPLTDPRPIVQPPDNSSAIVCGRASGASQSVSNIAIAHLELRHNPATWIGQVRGTNAVEITWQQGASGDNILVEGCDIHRFSTGMQLQPFIDGGDANNLSRGLVVRRCSIRNNYTNPAVIGEGTDSHGLFLGAHRNSNARMELMTIEENFFDTNGWDPVNWPRDTTGRDQHIYVLVYNEHTIAFRNNVVLRSAGTSQIRPGGVVSRCFFQQNTTGLTVGFVRGGSDPQPGGCPEVTVRESCFLEGTDVSPTTPAGNAFIVANAQSGFVEDNVVANQDTFATGNGGIGLNGDIDGTDEIDIGIRDMTVRNNVVYRYSQPLRLTRSGNAPGEGGVRFDNVVVEDNALEVAENMDQPSHQVAVAWDLPAGGGTVTWRNNRYQTQNSLAQAFSLFGTLVDQATWDAQTGDTGSTVTTTPTAYTDPDRNAESYLDLIDSTTGSTLDDYAAAMNAQRLGNWRTELEAVPLINYIREGFDLSPLLPL